MSKKIFALLLALAMMATLLAGCASTEPAAEPQPEPEQTQETTQVEESEAPAEEPAQEEAPDAEEPAQDTVEAPAEEGPKELYVYDLPLVEDTVTFSHWGEGSPPFIATELGAEQCFNTARATEYMEELTGIRIDYHEVDMFSKAEKFNLMIASEDYTDMIVGFDAMYSGGASQALIDEVIYDLTDYVENNMPAYKQIIDEGGYRSDLLSDDGEFLYITGFDDEVFASAGPAIRKDWLDQLGLDVPKTYDELYTVACAFRDEFDCKMPLYFTAELNPGIWFSGGFDIPAFDIDSNGSHFYQIDGEIKSAYVADGLKEMITLMAQYYQEELISKDFISREMGQDCEPDLFADDVGVYSGQANYITEYNTTVDNVTEGFHLVGLPNITKNPDDIIHFTALDGNGSGRNTVCITTNCDDVETLTTFLDFQFTKEGQVLNNFGMEGITFEYDENGEPWWIDGLPVSGVAFMKATVPYIPNALPSLFDADRRDKVTLDQDALDARQLYNEGTDGAYDLPVGMSFNEDETSTFYHYISDVDTYAAEFLLKCVYGEADVESGWDAYVDKLYELGLQTCIDMKQSAYDRYMAR